MVDPKPGDAMDQEVHHVAAATESTASAEAQRRKKPRRVAPGFEAKMIDVTPESFASEQSEEKFPDAWYADHGDASSRAVALRARREPEFMAEVVIGSDDRTRQTDTTAFPYRAICSLKITAGNGKGYIGTGWLAGPRTVITAGHCVFSKSQGGWAKSIEVVPGRNAAEQPLGAFTSREFFSTRGWIEQQKPEFDYAAILLPKTVSDNLLSHFAFDEFDEPENSDDLFHVVGYPGDKPLGTMWGHATPLSHVRPRVLEYLIDTYGGNSGGPVFNFNPQAAPQDQYCVLGIHNYGDLAGNSATRITRDVFENIKRWVARS